MKKHLQFLLLFAALLLPWAIQAQNVRVTVGTGTSASYATPFCLLYNNGTSQQVYLANEINQAGTIDTIWFYSATSNSITTASLKIYLGTTEASTLTSMLTADNFDEVYSATQVTLGGTIGWQAFVLDEPYLYNGSDNLVVAVCRKNTSYSSSVTWQYTSLSGMTRYRQSDGDASFGDLSSITTGMTGTSSSYRPNIMLSINPNYVPPTCPRTSLLSSSNITATTADISWTELGTATSWVVEYATSAITPGAGQGEVVTASDTIVTLTDLTPNTIYYAYVHADCGSGDTSLNRVIQFRTACAPMQVLPFFKDFEDEATTTSSTGSPFIPCWTRLNNGTSYGGYPYLTTSANHTAGGSKGFYWYASTTSGTYGDYYCIVLPSVDTDLYAINTLQLKFWAKVTGTSYIAPFQIGVISDPTDITTFQPVDTITIAGNTTWTEYLTSLASFTGNGQYVAIKAVRPASAWYAYMDDITLEVAPLCPEVTDLQATPGTISIAATWDIRGGVETPASYDVEITEMDTTSGPITTTYTATEPSYTFTGLSAGTQYKIRVRTSCSSENGPWDSVMVSTTALPCIEVDPTTADTITTTIGTSTQYAIPVNNFYNYSYTQQLFTAAELNGAATFTGIDFQYNYYDATIAKTNCTIYVANVAQSSLSSGFVPYSSDFQVVYTGSINVQSGWNHFEFARSFNYDGTSNLLIAVLDNSGAYDGSSYVWASHSATGKARAIQNDGSPYNISSISTTDGSSSSSRCNMRLYSGECLQVADCMPPTVAIDSADAHNVYLSWQPGYQETSWDVEYRTGSAGQWSTVVAGTSATTAIVSGLSASTLYEFRVGSICSDTTLYDVISYRTPCDVITVPYTEDFETYGTGTTAFPTCWYRRSTSADRPYIHATTTYGHNNSHGLYFYAAGAGYCYAIMPPTNHAIDSLQVTFWARQYGSSYNCSFAVGVLSDPDDPSTFVAIDTVHPASIDYEEFEVPLNRYTGNGRYIAFSAILNSGSYIYLMLDDVTLDYIPSCPKPTNVTADYIGADTITLSWSPVGSETQWLVSDGINEYVANDSTYTFDQLSPNTLYNFTIRALCSGDDTSRTTLFSVRTSCGLLNSLPFTEDFDNQTTGTSSTSSPFIPCWTRLNNGTSYGGYPYVTTSYNHTDGGSKCLYWYATTTTGTYGDYYCVVLPEADSTLYPVNTLQVDFWAKVTTASYSAPMQIGVMTDPTDITTFQPIDTVTVSGTTDWQLFEVPLTSFTGVGTNVAIKAVRSTSAWYVAMDDITLRVAPSCFHPNDAAATTVTCTDAMLHWTPGNVGQSNFVARYGTLGCLVDTCQDIPVSGADSLLITGLDTGTYYTFYVAAICDEGDTTPWNSVTFRTLAGEPVSEFPYTCTFAGTQGNAWDLAGQGQTNQWYVGNAAFNPGADSMGLYISNNNGLSNAYTINSISYAWAYRTLLLQPGEYAYSFDWKGQGESYYYDYMRPFLVPASVPLEGGQLPNGMATYAFATATAPAGWIDLSQVTTSPYTLAQQTTWQTVTGTFTVTQAGTYNFAFVWANDASGGTNPPTAVDNIYINRNLCSQVVNLSTPNVTADSIYLTWGSVGTETSWLVQLDSAGTVTDFTVTDSSIAIGGLTSNTNYTVRVYALCSEGDTSMASTLTLRTPCTAMPVPYVNNFDTETTGIYPPCWSYTMTGSASYQTGNYLPKVYATSYAHSAPNALWLYGVGYFCLPPMSVPLDSLQISFWNYTTSASYGLELGVMEGNTFVPIQMVTPSAPSTPEHLTIYLSQYTGTSRIIAFRNFYTSSSTIYYSYHYLDDIEVDYIPSCPPCTDLHSTGNTASSVSLAWQENGSAQEWQIAAETSAGATPTPILTVFADTATVNGLAAGQNYYFYVRSVCGPGDTSAWSDMFMCTPGSWNMRTNQTDTLYTCGAVVYDDGGPTGTYASSQNSTVVLMPGQSGNLISVSGSSYTESSYDYLTIYDGIGTSGTMLWTDNGIDALTNFGPFTSTNGPITIMFHSDGSLVRDGFEINVSCVSTSCRVLNVRQNPAVPRSDSHIALTWDTTDAIEYHVEYGPAGFTQGTGTMLTVYNNSVTVQGLTGLTNYDFYVRSYCYSGDTGSWTGPTTLSTEMCDNPGIAYSYDSTWSATTNSYAPMGYSFYDYGYVQTIIDSAQIANLGGDITAMAFSSASGSQGSYYTNMNIYLANVSESTLTDFITPDATHQFVQVTHNADLSYSTAGWHVFGLDTVFTWDGHSNLLVAVLRNHGSYQSGASFNVHTTSSVKTIYDYQDDTPFSITSAYGGYTGSFVGDFMFYSCSGTTCPTPAITSVNHDYQSATITWSGNGTNYEIDYRTLDGTYGNPVAVTGTTYTITGLQPATTYMFRVRMDCTADSNDYSNWVESSFTTDSLPCFAPANFRSTDVTNSTAAFAWTVLGEETAWEIHVFNTTFDQYFEVNTNPATVNGLTTGVTYNAAIRALCGSAHTILGDWGDTIQFTTAVCDPVTNVAATASGLTINLTWTPGANNCGNFEVEYGEHGFGQGEGTTVAVSGNSKTFTDLEELTQYDFYVRAICADGWTSAWSSLATATTGEVQGIHDVNGNFSCTIFPNPATDETTISVSGVNGQVTVAVVDMNGRIVSAETLDCAADCVKKVNVSGLTQGAYFVRITGDNVNSVKKLIVR